MGIFQSWFEVSLIEAGGSQLAVQMGSYTSFIRFSHCGWHGRRVKQITSGSVEICFISWKPGTNMQTRIPRLQGIRARGNNKYKSADSSCSACPGHLPQRWRQGPAWCSELTLIQSHLTITEKFPPKIYLIENEAQSTESSKEKPKMTKRHPGCRQCDESLNQALPLTSKHVFPIIRAWRAFVQPQIYSADTLCKSLMFPLRNN